VTEFVAVIFDRGEVPLSADTIAKAARDAVLLAGGDEDAVFEVRRADYRDVAVSGRSALWTAATEDARASLRDLAGR
jgi:hypothetical protein